MTKYILIPDGYEGNLSCYYDDKGYLMEFSISSWNIMADDHQHVLESLGYLVTESLLPQFVKQMGMKFRKAKIDLSFDRFWTMYGNARNKIPAQRLWDKLSEKQRYHVIINLKSFLRYCKRNPKYTQMYPDTYLRAHTQDNWDKVADWTGSQAPASR